MHTINTLIEYITSDIVGFIVLDENVKIDNAMHRFYNSPIFEKLHDRETGLYLHGSAYVYELFKETVPVPNSATNAQPTPQYAGIMTSMHVVETH